MQRRRRRMRRPWARGGPAEANESALSYRTSLVSAAAACVLLALLPAHGAIPELADGGTYATGQTNRKTQASVRGAAYPPQWLPVLLLTAATSPSPPLSRMPPPPSPPSPYVFTIALDLRT